MPSSKYRIANIDIENFPLRGFAWEQKTKYPTRENLIDVDRDWNIASFAVKWEGERGPTTCLALPDFKKTYKNDPYDDSVLLDRMYDILDAANLIVGHNVDAFDLRKINARLWKRGSIPPRVRRTFDTLKETRKLFLLPSYGLGAIAKFLGCPYGGKREHEGFPMWIKCMNGDMDAWARFKAYNSHDVKIDDWVYHRLRPWSRNHPNITLESGKARLCPVCGYFTKYIGLDDLKSYQVKVYRCMRKACGKTSRGARIKVPFEVLS